MIATVLLRALFFPALTCTGPSPSGPQGKLETEELELTPRTFPHVGGEYRGHEDLLGHPEVRSRIVRFLSGEEVGDARLPAPPIRFVPLGQEHPGVTHPSLEQSSGR